MPPPKTRCTGSSQNKTDAVACPDRTSAHRFSETPGHSVPPRKSETSRPEPSTVTPLMPLSFPALGKAGGGRTGSCPCRASTPRYALGRVTLDLTGLPPTPEETTPRKTPQPTRGRPWWSGCSRRRTTASGGVGYWPRMSHAMRTSGGFETDISLRQPPGGTATHVIGVPPTRISPSTAFIGRAAIAGDEPYPDDRDALVASGPVHGRAGSSEEAKMVAGKLDDDWLADAVDMHRRGVPRPDGRPRSLPTITSTTRFRRRIITRCRRRSPRATCSISNPTAQYCGRSASR